MILDAARAAHIAGVGAHGSGFLSDPKEVLRQATDAGVNLVAVRHLGQEATRSSMAKDVVLDRDKFPSALPRISLCRAKLRVTMTKANSYLVTLDGVLKTLQALGFANTGGPS
jgi:hypothetical protein